MRTSLPMLILVLVTVALAGCGKVGAPSPPGPPDQVTYPRTFPAF